MNASSRKFAEPLLMLLLLIAMALTFVDAIPNAWRWTYQGSALVLVIGMLIAGIRRGHWLEPHEQLRREGKCVCGYDLRGAPPRETSRHLFDVWGRMRSTKKTIVCPECGKKHVVWEHD